MKLPNGFGTVYKMQGNRRRPYVAKKTIQGKQQAIGYFETFEDAMALPRRVQPRPCPAESEPHDLLRGVRALEGQALPTTPQ